jgi:HK97 family phage major capsid protein/HK97 family phage prohead protease
MDRAYALLSVKAFDGDRRTITGLASTPTPDRRGDILEPLGATFSNPLPLLLHHDRERPVGRVTLTAKRDGIAFEATLPEIAEPGAVRDRVNEAWHSIKAGLITGVSIGFRPLADGVAFLKSGGMHLLKTEICELSLVTVPANVETTIHTIKSFDQAHLAASGLTPPGVAGLPKIPRPAMKQTAAEHIQNLENKRAACTARMTEILQTGAEDGATLAAEPAAEHDGLAAQVKSLDADLVRWRELEKMQMATATAAPALRMNSYAGQVSVKPNVEIGTAFIRAAMAKLVCKGNIYEAAEYAKRWEDSTPEVSLFLKAAVAPGTTQDAAWAKPLTTPGNVIVEEFLQLLRPATILGKIAGFSRVPFLVPVPTVTAGGTYGWVGEAKPKPVTRMQFGSTNLPIAKAAGIIVLTEELVRTSNPSAEAVVRREMVAGIAAFLDKSFIDPAVAEVANVSPASVTNGVTPITATTNPLADLLTLLQKFTAAGLPVGGVNLIMSSTNALALSFFRNGDGSATFPGLSVSGGTISGVSVIVSDAAGDDIVAVLAPYILYADDGGVSVDVSREASVQMDSAPTSPADATTVLVSLWQNNLVGLRAERFINWKKGHAQAAQYIDGASYAPLTGAPTSAPTVKNGRAA